MNAFLISFVYFLSIHSSISLPPPPNLAKLIPTPTVVRKQVIAKTTSPAVAGAQTAQPSSPAPATYNNNSIQEALNALRQRNGVGALRWNSGLAGFAQGRANHFNDVHGLDGHSGFQDFANNPDNLRNLGLHGVGENSSFGNGSDGRHLVEDIFANHDPHKGIQLDPSWTQVGVGISGDAVDVVFGK